MDKEHTQYPSRYALGEKVKLELPEASKTTVSAVRFTEGKVWYDVRLLDEHGDTFAILQNLDSVLVKDA